MLYRQISEELGVPKSTVYGHKKWFEEETVGRRPGSGRRRITSAQDDEGIIDIIQNRPFTTAIEAVKQTNFPHLL
jgi:transposase